MQWSEDDGYPDDHIMVSDGERPDRNCKYSQWLNDCDRFLLGKEVET